MGAAVAEFKRAGITDADVGAIVAAAGVAHGTFFYDSGAPGLDELLRQDPDLTAIFAVSDEMAAAAVNELQERGRRVPDDVSVLGFDNTSTAQHVHPPLSTVAQPLEEMGRAAVRKLLRARNLGPRIVPHSIIARGSTGPPKNQHQPSQEL